MKKNQTSDILQHLKDGKRLTQKEAINEFGAYRLSAIIHSLRNQGHNIESIPLSVPTRYSCKNGKPRMANIVEYKLTDNQNNFKEEYSKKKDKILNDIFESDHQGILSEKKVGFDQRLINFIKEVTE